MHPLINIAIRAARNASKIILRATDRIDTIEVKQKNKNEFVTDIDKLAELEIIKTIHDSYPDHAIIGEETGNTGSGDYTWIIDPIDGTTNFFHGNPHFCISIAIKCKDKMEHALIYDPLRQELFTASHGVGAFLNERRIRVNQKKQLPNTSINMGFSSKNLENLELYLKMLASILPLSVRLRATGSAALDLAYVACGRVDGFWGMELPIWDMAAGTLIVQEAGGIITDFAGTNKYINNGNIIAGNQHISNTLLRITRERTQPITNQN